MCALVMQRRNKSARVDGHEVRAKAAYHTEENNKEESPLIDQDVSDDETFWKFSKSLLSSL